MQPSVLSETLSLGRMLFTPETSWVFLRLIENADRYTTTGLVCYSKMHFRPSMYMGPLGKKMLKRDQTLRSALEFTKLAEIPTPDVCLLVAKFK